MNKTAIKNFAVWARKKLMGDISYKAGLMGITEEGIKAALPQSTRDMALYDIGTKEPYRILGKEIKQHQQLVAHINKKAAISDYKTAYHSVVEEVAYTWFNRLIAIRFMEVNDYLPSGIRVLSSESPTKLEPNLMTTPFAAGLSLTEGEKAEIMGWKDDNQVPAQSNLFHLLFIKQCNALNEILPKLFEKTEDYSELLLNVSVTDPEGVVYHLVHDIAEDDFNIAKIGADGKPTGQVEIIGWLYQYYNIELNEFVYDGNMSKSRIPKELLPAATTIYTPDWAIKYMVENSLGRLWLEGHPNDKLQSSWQYYLEEAEQEAEVQLELEKIREEYKNLRPEDIKIIDPCMGSGHILVYAFDLLMQIYESVGYTQRDAAKSILEHNIYGLDIDDRAFQLAYFAVMMKARQYNRRILSSETTCHIYAIKESNPIIDTYHREMGNFPLPQGHQDTLNYLLEVFEDAKEYGSILQLEQRDYQGLLEAWKCTVSRTDEKINMAFWDKMVEQDISLLIEQAIVLADQYDVVATNPPYLGSSRFSSKLDAYVKKNYAEVKSDLSMVVYKHCLGALSKRNGFISFITTSSWMFLSSFEKLRNYVLPQFDFDSVVDFGTELFEGKVGHNPIVAWVNRHAKTGKSMTGIRLVEYCYSRRDEKEPEFFNIKNHYVVKQENFAKIPGSPIAYWVSEKMLGAFEKGRLLGSLLYPKTGMTTGDNNRFLRRWYETDITKTMFNAKDAKDAETSTKKWFPYCKGGGYKRWFGYNEYLINWEHNGFEIKNNIKDNGVKAASVRSEQLYFQELLTWSAVTSGKFSCRYVGGGALFDSGGSSILINRDDYYNLALLNGKIGQFYLNISNATINYQPGDIAGIPVLIDKEEKIQFLSEENISLSKADWDAFETSWDFEKHPLVQPCATVAEAYGQWEAECENRFTQLKANEEELNRIFIDIYGLQDELTPEVEDKDVTVRRADLQRDMRSLISYAVGCVFGRYSLDLDGLAYAGGEWDDGKYSSFIPNQDNILPITDEEYFKDDIVGLFCGWLKKVYGVDTLEENLDFIAKALGNKGNTSREIIRNYFLKDFFADHCKIYQKRPIYWLFDSGKQNGFKALIYIHRYDENTIGNLRIDYLHRVERAYESEIARMQDEIDNSTSAREETVATKRKEKLQKQLKECKDYDERIAHLALARTTLDLDDGVKVNYEKIQTGADGKQYPVLAKI